MINLFSRIPCWNLNPSPSSRKHINLEADLGSTEIKDSCAKDDQIFPSSRKNTRKASLVSRRGTHLSDLVLVSASS